MKAQFVVVGGGIAGVTCVETLAFYHPNERIVLISESSLIKTVTNLLAITQTLTTFEVEETSIDSFTNKHSNVVVINSKLVEICSEGKFIVLSSNVKVEYVYLCLCMGASPKLISQGKHNRHVLGIRDTDSVEIFIQKLRKSKQIVIVGNGGIASELVYKVKGVNVHWVIKDEHTTATFVDPGVAEFFKDSLNCDATNEPTVSKRMRYVEDKNYKSGAALGPDWYKHFDIKGANDELQKLLKIHYKSEIVDVRSSKSQFPIECMLNDGSTVPCDFIVSATGVEPKLDFKIDRTFSTSSSKEVDVNQYMETSIPDIFAAGDICNATWVYAKHWFPMKLWTQARQMGCYAAKCMSGKFTREEVLQDFCFEIFTHSTRLFGYKVVLLGLFNGQKLGTDYEILFRMTKGHEFVKLVLQDGKLQGAILVGDTDLEEMCENLILNQLDLSMYKEDLLNPNIDIEDYFD